MYYMSYDIMINILLIINILAVIHLSKGECQIFIFYSIINNFGLIDNSFMGNILSIYHTHLFRYNHQDNSHDTSVKTRNFVC